MDKDALFTACLLFVLSGSYFFWWITTNTVLKIIIKLLLCFLFFKNTKKITSSDRWAITLYCSALILQVFLAIIHNNANFFGVIDMLTNFAMIPILLAGVAFSERVYEYFRNIFSFVFALSLIAVLFYMIGMLPVIGELTSGQGRTYTIYPFLVKENMTYLFPRFCSVFDEPGAVGTYSAIFLCVNRFNLKDWKNIVFLLAGLISMSMFFYILIVLYLLYFLIINKRKYLSAILLCVAISSFYYVTKDDPYLYGVMWSRFEWDEDEGKFIGDNRMVGDADYYFEHSIKGTPAYWWGTDDIKEFWDYSEGSSSYKVVVASNGMVFLMLYLLVFIVLAYGNKHNTSGFLLFVLLLLLITYQRPNMYYPVWIFLYTYYTRNQLG